MRARHVRQTHRFGGDSLRLSAIAIDDGEDRPELIAHLYSPHEREEGSALPRAKVYPLRRRLASAFIRITAVQAPGGCGIYLARATAPRRILAPMCIAMPIFRH